MGSEDAVELDQGLVVEDDMVDLVDGDAGLFEAEIDTMGRERGVTFDPGEPFFLCCCDDAAVVEEDSCGVVVEG